MANRVDGYYDAFIRHGVQQYMYNNTYYEAKSSDAELTMIYQNALARRIVTSPIDDCVKHWLKIDGDKDDKILQYMQTLDVEGAFVEAGYWDRLYGRSCIFIMADDGGSPMDAVNYNKLDSIRGLVVYDKRDIIEDMSGLLRNDDPNDDNFGKTEYYTICPMNGKPFDVHHSRLLMFNGETLPRRERIANNGAGLSCLDGVIKAIRRNDTAHARALDIIERVSQAVLKLKGLSDMLMTDDGTMAVKTRLDMLDMARNILNSMAIDTEDDFQIHNMSVAGIREIIQEFQQEISGMTGIPVTILFGRSPGGENSTGAADFENYYNAVRRYQHTKMKPQLEKLIKMIQCCKNGPTNGKEYEDWQIEFNPLKEMTEREEIDIASSKAGVNKTKVDTVKAMLDMQVMDAKEARAYLYKETEIVPNAKVPEQKPQEEQPGAAQQQVTNTPQNGQPKELTKEQ
jgi:phage-related protein (TIGR01555 family)